MAKQHRKTPCRRILLLGNVGDKQLRSNFMQDEDARATRTKKARKDAKKKSNKTRGVALLLPPIEGAEIDEQEASGDQLEEGDETDEDIEADEDELGQEEEEEEEEREGLLWK